MKKGTIIGLLAGLLLNEEKLTPINMAVATTAGGMAASSLSEAADAPDTKETITTTLLYCSVPSDPQKLRKHFHIESPFSHLTCGN